MEILILILSLFLSRSFYEGIILADVRSFEILPSKI